MACSTGLQRPFSTMWLAFSLLCLALTATVASAAEAGNVAAKGCGGFVKSQKNIDFSTIEIVMETQTQNGWRKVGTTDCAPNNGYYFLPIQPGDLTGGPGATTNFRLTARPPTGWKIRPEEGVVVAVDGATDACSTNKDINFEFVGFGITGSVLSKDSSSGPSDISVELLEKGKAAVVKTALTGADGSYVFFGVLPGAYTIRVSQEAQTLYSFEKTTQDIEVGESEGRSAPFLISGYSLVGRVSAARLACKDADLSGVDVKMLSADGGKVLANTKTDASGAYKFSNVAVGSYLIRVDGSASSLDIDSTEQAVQVGHSHLTVSEFQVVGYTVSGQVAASRTNGQRPLSGVDLKVTSNTGAQYSFKTDKEGKFVIKGVKSCCQMSVNAILDGYDFEVATFDSVGPRTVLSPTIVPKRYRLSGRVDRSSLPTDLEIKVKFGQDGGKVLVSEKGTFSLYLPEGAYDVTVEVKASDSLASRGIGFAPVKQAVAVTDSPVADINFQPIKANVGGVVSVLNEFATGSTLEVSLKAKDGGLGAADAKKQTIKLTAGSAKSSGKFRFSNVLPGTYSVAVHGSEGSRICWSKAVQEITVSSDIDDIAFDQVGFYLQVESPHPTTLVISKKKGETQDAALKQGRNSICVDTKKGHQDDFALTTKGCEKFEIEPKSVKAMAAAAKVVLKPTHYLVSGRIFSKAAVTNLELKVKSEVRTVKLQTVRDEARGFYSFSFDALPNEELSFVPQSEEFLFDPENIHVFVENSCHLDAVHFDAVGGFFLRGQITPAVENVKVSVIAPSDSQAGVNKMAAAVSHTDAAGRFRLGPLPQETPESGQYRIEAVKEGYVFEQVKGGPRGHFASKKLAAIVVEVDSGNKDTRLEGAVISVSGGGNTGSSYRSNTHTDSQGEAHFLSLSPGEYFVKPQLKEFEFSPKHKLIDIVEGQTSTIKFEAKRVAFSAFGKVRSINGESEAGITLRAKQTGKCQGKAGAAEEATSEAKGDFRFRGLVPGCEYSIGLREADAGEAVIERLIPAETRVVMGAADAQVKDAIVAFRTVNIMDVTMTVNDEANPISEAPVKVVMTDHQSYSYSVKRIIGEMITLPAVTKEPGKKYTITVETFPEKYAPKRKVSTVVATDEFYKFVNVTIPKGAAASAKDSAGNAQSSANKKMLIVIVLFLSGLGAYFYKDKLPGSLVALVDRIGASATSSGGRSYQKADDGGPTNKGDDSSVRKRPSSRRPKLMS